MKNIKLIFQVAALVSVSMMFAGCKGIKEDPRGGVDAPVRVDIDKDVSIKNEGGRIVLLQDGQIQQPCGSGCGVFKDAVQLLDFDIKSYRVGREETQVVRITYSPTGPRKPIKVASLDNVDTRTATDVLSNSFMLAHNIADQCPGSPKNEPSHNGCCTYVIYIIGRSMYELINGNDRDCKIHR